MLGKWKDRRKFNPTLVDCPIQLFDTFQKKQAQGIRCPNPLFIALSRFQGGEDPPLCLNNPDYSNPLLFVNLGTEKHLLGKIHGRRHLTFGAD